MHRQNAYLNVFLRRVTVGLGGANTNDSDFCLALE